MFAVGDLLERHPTDPLRWKVFGRKDDQIVLSTGENINPLPIEGVLAHDPLIASAVMFGRHRIYPGVLVEPVAAYKDKLDEFKEKLWWVIDKYSSSDLRSADCFVCTQADRGAG